MKWGRINQLFRSARSQARRGHTTVHEVLEGRRLLSVAPGGTPYLAVAHPFQSTLDLAPGGVGVVNILDGVDDGFAVIPLGEDRFNFYGETYTGAAGLFVSSNGFLSFGQGSRQWDNDDLTASEPFKGTELPAVAPLWDDWRTDAVSPTRANNDAVLYKFEPCRLIVEWNKVVHYSGVDNSVTFQAILELNTSAPGQITFNYFEIETPDYQTTEGASATVGVKAAGAGQDVPRLLVSHGVPVNPLVGTGKAIRISASNLPPTLDAGGPYTVDEGKSVEITPTASDPDGDTLTYRWDFDGDGVFTDGTASEWLTGADGPATVNVAVQVDDGHGHVVTDTAVVAVSNVAPMVTVTAPDTVNEGQRFGLVLGRDVILTGIEEPVFVTESEPVVPVVNDPGADTVTEYVVHWGDDTSVRITAAGLERDGRTLYHAYADDRAGAAQITVDVIDEDGTHPAAGTTSVSVRNVAPTVALSGSASVDEGAGYTLSLGAIVDPGGDTVTSYAVDWGDGSIETVAAENLPADRKLTHRYADGADGGTARAITVNVADEDGTHAAGSTGVTVNNAAPAATFTGITGTGAGNVVAAGVAVTFHGAFTDPGSLDTHTARWEVSDDNFARVVGTATGTVDATSRTVTGGYAFPQPGVYTVRLIVSDADGGTGVATHLGEFEATVVVYDASTGHVSGGGWINSPAGSFAPNPSLTGKAQFAFVSKYQKGSLIPVGQTSFTFKTAGLDFDSSTYEFLVISGHKAQFRGTGTLNGKTGYRFKLTVIDGQRSGGGGQDKFRMQISDPSGTLVYDNQRTYDTATRVWVSAEEDADPTTLLGGGSIVIHS